MSARALWEELRSGGWPLLERWKQERKLEALDLEFKRVAADGPVRDDKRNLAKALSAFSNTEGGVLILGVETSKIDGVDAVAELRPVANCLAWAQLCEQLVKDVVVPAVRGVRVEPVARPGSSEGVVVVYVPASAAPPHRAEGTDLKQYWMRTTTSSMVVPHNLLASLFGLRPPPVLELALVRRDLRAVRVQVRNVGSGAAAHVLVRMRVPPSGSPVRLDFECFRPWESRHGEVWIDGEPAWDGVAAYAGRILYPDSRLIAGTFGNLLPNEVRLEARLDAEGMRPVVIERQVAITTEPVWIGGEDEVAE
jgi:hypothetical protein